jgi:methionyl aminopeptidase
MAIIIKTQKQIDGIRKACQFAASILDMIEPFVVEGVTTNELNQRIHQYHIMNGAIPAPLGYKGFPKSSCISINEVICHGIPDNTVLKNGDIVNIDVTPILDGFYGDTSRMYTVGDIEPVAKNLIEVTKQSLELGIKQVKPGNHFGAIGCAITGYAESNGFSVVHQFVGHGTGVNFHEEPGICHYCKDPNSGPVMKEGMIFTIEPMINEGVAEGVVSNVDGWTATTFDGKLSAQFEHSVLVTKDGAEVLTRTL